MAWHTDGLIILRDLIGDYDAAYAEAKLKRLLAVAAYRIRQDVSFDIIYEVDLTSGSELVTPDPSGPPKDYDFINLMALRASISVITGELKLSADQSISITDGPSKITVEKGKYLKNQLDIMKSQYDEYIKNYLCSKSKFGGAVTGPISKEFIYSDYSDYRD